MENAAAAACREDELQSLSGPWPCCQHHTSLPLSCLHGLENEICAILQAQSWIKMFQNISTECAGEPPKGRSTLGLLWLTKGLRPVPSPAQALRGIHHPRLPPAGDMPETNR